MEAFRADYNGECVHCGKTLLLEGGAVDIVGAEAEQEVHCNACGTRVIVFYAAMGYTVTAWAVEEMGESPGGKA